MWVFDGELRSVRVWKFGDSLNSQKNNSYFLGNDLWRRLDDRVRQTQTQNVTADAHTEVQRCRMEPNTGRLEDPLQYWERQKYVYPHLYKLAVAFLCPPASSVPCEPVFSKAGEILSKKRNGLRPATVEKLLFLNKNQ
ncbi:hypothetical protein NL108_007845 [Boleophthalmus pectinirostris]|nr:hypothetical protein NL108_007845 [Boleophthalmus pectinirostris]